MRADRIGARFVYILRSDSDPSRHYVGRTANVDDRLEWHNHGPCGYTLDRPWSIVVSLEFPNESAAARFEKYLKSGSGRAFRSQARRSFRGRRAIEDQRVGSAKGHVDPFMRGNLDLYWCQTHAYRRREGIQ